MKTSDTTGWTGIPGINRWREAGGIMKDFFLYLMIYAGSVLMACNIYRYVCFFRDVRKLLPLRDRYGDRSQPLLLNMHMNHGIHITLPDRKVQMYDRDFDTYMQLFNLMMSMVREPDLLIYLKSSVPHLVSQIQKRGRDYEKSISIEYLNNLNERYEQWIKEYKGQVLVIEADELDFENRPEDFSSITDKIDAQLFGLF